MIKIPKGILAKNIEEMPAGERAEFMTLLKELDGRAYYQLNPLEWAKDVLGVPENTIKWSLNPGYEKLNGPRILDDGTVLENGWDGTPDPILTIMNAIAAWKDVAVEAASGVGKTYAAAIIALWFLDCFIDSKVIITAPKEDQIKENFWGEVQRFERAFKEKRPDAEFMDLKIRMIKGNDRWTATGFVAGVKAGEEVATKAAGKHAEHMLFIIDETPGVPIAILEAIENTCTSPHNLRLALGNPDGVNDSLHSLYVRDDFVSVRISAYDHPNIVMNDPKDDVRNHVILIPGAVSWKSINARRKKYGTDPEIYNNHPIFKSRVRGIVPSGSSKSLFSNKVLEAIGEYYEKTGWRFEEYYQLSGNPSSPVEGRVVIYQNAENTHINRYVLFADVAEDGAGGDFHACVVLDRITKQVVATIRMKGHRTRYVKEILKLARMYRSYDWENDQYYWPVLNWERNSSGALHLVPEFAEYPELYQYRKTDIPGVQRMRRQKGHYTNVRSRADMIKELEDWGFTLLENPWRVSDKDLYEEMKTFVWNERKRRFEHESGFHDDLVMALSGALLTDKHIPPPVATRSAPDADYRYAKVMRKTLLKKKKKHGTAWDRAKIPQTL